MNKLVLVLLSCSFFVSASWGLVWSYIPVNMYNLGSDFLRIVFIESFPAISYLLSRVWGATSDYYGRRKVFIVIGYSLSTIPLILAGLARSVDMLIMLIMISNFFNSIWSPAYYAALGIHGGGEVYGYLQMIASLGGTLGAIALGPIYAYGGQFGVYAAASLSTVAAALIVLVLYTERRSKFEVRSDLLSYLKSSIKFKLRAKPQFKSLLVAAFVVWIAVFWNSGLLKIKLYRILEQSVESYSLIIGFGAGLLSIPASFAAARLARKFGGAVILTIGLLCYSVIIPILGWTHSPPIYVLLYVLPVWPFFWAGQFSLTHELSEEKFEGENMGTLMTVTNSSALPALIGGLVADYLGLDSAVLATSALYLLSLAILLWILGKKL